MIKFDGDYTPRGMIDLLEQVEDATLVYEVVLRSALQRRKKAIERWTIHQGYGWDTTNDRMQVVSESFRIWYMLNGTFDWRARGYLGKLDIQPTL